MAVTYPKPTVGSDKDIWGPKLNNYLDAIKQGINVKEYGAVGDGVTDDTAAIQAAIDAPGASGGIVFAPSNTYLIGTTIDIPSNIILQGAGWNVTIFKAKAGLDSPVLSSDGTSNVHLRDFRVEGNSTNQGAGGVQDGIDFIGNVTHSSIENVWVNDVRDWGFGMKEVTDLVINNNIASAIIGTGVVDDIRGGFLFGTSGPTWAYDVIITNNRVIDVTEMSVNGFELVMCKRVQVRGNSALTLPCGGFVINTGNNISFNDNLASKCLVGFELFGNATNISFIGNRAYQNAGPGFTINPLVSAKNIIISNNFSIENGQNQYSAFYGDSGNRIGFDLNPSAGITVENVTLVGNIATDNQESATQAVGFRLSGEQAGSTVSHLVVSGNVSRGNISADYTRTSNLDLTTLISGVNYGTSNTVAHLVLGAVSSKALHFTVDDVAASSGVVTMNLPGSSRGYVMPRNGYLRGITVLSTTAVTGGSITFQPQKGGVNFGTSIVITSGTLNSAAETLLSNTFVAGNIITCTYSSNAGFLPDGTNDFDVVVEVVYQ